MGTLYAMLSVAGWAFLIGLLGYVMVRSRRTDAAMPINERSKDE